MGWTEPTPGPFTLSPCFPTAVRATSQGGDLMSDLFNKLAMRRKGRKQDPGAASFLAVFRSVGPGWPDQLLTLASALPGISGKGPGSGASEGPGGAFARMSDSIPPLPPPQQPPGEEDEDDWES